MKKVLEKYIWYAIPIIILLIALYEWLIEKNLSLNKFYGSFILLILAFAYIRTQDANKKD